MPCGRSSQDGEGSQRFWGVAPDTAPKLTHSRDESFNSITGLNGSGKSNILDSICFVLGITNMSTVRAQNLQVRHEPAQSSARGS